MVYTVQPYDKIHEVSRNTSVDLEGLGPKSGLCPQSLLFLIVSHLAPDYHSRALASIHGNQDWHKFPQRPLYLGPCTEADC